MVEKNYPAYYSHIGQLSEALATEIPGPMAAFSQLHSSAVADGALSGKVKELIALAIGIAVHCDGCISFHVHDAINAGATRPEIAETIGVAVLMGGGPSMVYGSEALEALDQFEASSN